MPFLVGVHSSLMPVSCLMFWQPNQRTMKRELSPKWPLQIFWSIVPEIAAEKKTCCWCNIITFLIHTPLQSLTISGWCIPWYNSLIYGALDPGPLFLKWNIGHHRKSSFWPHRNHSKLQLTTYQPRADQFNLFTIIKTNYRIGQDHNFKIKWKRV